MDETGCGKTTLVAASARRDDGKTKVGISTSSNETREQGSRQNMLVCRIHSYAMYEVGPRTTHNFESNCDPVVLFIHVVSK